MESWNWRANFLTIIERIETELLPALELKHKMAVTYYGPGDPRAKEIEAELDAWRVVLLGQKSRLN